MSANMCKKGEKKGHFCYRNRTFRTFLVNKIPTLLNRYDWLDCYAFARSDKIFFQANVLLKGILLVRNKRDSGCLQKRLKLYAAKPSPSAHSRSNHIQVFDLLGSHCKMTDGMVSLDRQFALFGKDNIFRVLLFKLIFLHKHGNFSCVHDFIYMVRCLTRQNYDRLLCNTIQSI